ncbi:DNA topoisomerase IB [Altibacter sp. HG106]|uniref:DNA topoisomerase IB n=1 Tax=Altibacter sp. HG106 TaxID=3023937 RepID=UPI00234FBBA8|nr:DNA topoisomerase IB [Altibacter sp. HG106]MDC7995295.1 DNA topoisomerase IB [Altibacter sp. HG106]
MVISVPKVKKLINNPNAAVKLANLVYITEEKLSIQRHKHGRGFYYTQQDKKITSKKALKRFKSLVIPPAWTEVRITPLENGHLQVVGRDEKQRKQYRYHPHWSELRNQTKFLKMGVFGKALPKIRQQIAKDLRLRTMTKRKCLALVIRLMEETHIRIGNDYYAKRNKSYGLSTLRSKHLDVYKNTIKFNFVGKKGKEHSVTLKNKRLQRLVLACEEIPGWELFKYYDEDGKHHQIDSGMVNDYIQEISDDFFTAKDFRTWAASKVFFETLCEIGPEEDEKQLKKNILEAYDAAANSLGNTRAVCRDYYVHPLLVERYENGTLTSYCEQVSNDTSKDEFLSASEKVLQELFQEYTFQLEDAN